MANLADAQWVLAETEAGAHDIGSIGDAALSWAPAIVPGSAAAALASAGEFDPDNPRSLHDKDIWYRTRFSSEPGQYTLTFEGLATVASVFLNGKPVLEARNMFRAHQAGVTFDGENELIICFHALEPVLSTKGPRARWKTRLVTHQGLRLFRTTLLGHMPGWCPKIHAIGPYRPIRITPAKSPAVRHRKLEAGLDQDGNGILRIEVDLQGAGDEVSVVCAGRSSALQKDSDGMFRGELLLGRVTPWMPHTHGEPALYEVALETRAGLVDLGKTGFRRIDVDRGEDGKGFGLIVNGVPIFARGAVWTSADLLGLGSDPETYRLPLELARDAGMNMLRVGGTMLYESRAFFELCDELGILVWQDFQFANFDYPVGDEDFAAEVRAEARYQLGVLQGSPSLAVLCGGSEIYQQGAMMGLPERRWKGDLCEVILPEVAAELRPDVPYVPNSPCGGDMPFSPNTGIAHYYGVGAYKRPLDDLRRANVRFAGECLAFSNIPEQSSLDAMHLSGPGHDPDWKANIPRDRGAGWDFEDVRDHYAKQLFGIDPQDLRYSDPERYLDIGRAVTSEVMEAAYSEWRRPASSCNGTLVWTYQDLKPGAGWGVLDARGNPKPVYYALKRAFRPLQVSVTDEGANGLLIQMINDRAEAWTGELSVTCFKDGKVPVVSGKRDVTLPAHGSLDLNAVQLIGAFFDATYAYRFGPPSHDVTVVRLADPESGKVYAEAFHFPLGLRDQRFPAEVETGLEESENGAFVLRLTAQRFLQSVHMDVPGFRPDDDWFHIAPGASRQIVLRPADGGQNTPERPAGTLAALNCLASVRIG